MIYKNLCKSNPMTYNLSYFGTSASPEKIYNVVKSIIFILVMKVFF